MATGVSRGKIQMTPSDSMGLKIGGRCKQHAVIFHGGRVPKFVAIATGVGREEI